jgi:crotonobetainyl-CoA:carnitine CoA-transferase CaiB-like acyl-CoA transferase
MLAPQEQPLSGIRVIEFSHMVMGPSVGVILADLGADVIRVEPPGGDQTRRLLGSGAGYFPMFNRNKRSVCLDLKHADGLAAALALCDGADVVIENFRPGTLDRLGLGFAALRARNPRLVCCSAKGFLDGPYDHRTALDEVTQMMGGLAYMTGPVGRPLRAGTSVVDITGGMFGVIGVLAAIERRHRTGEGGEVKCALYETTAFLVGQHMAQQAVTGKAPDPMPSRISAWAIYDVFETRNTDEQLFVGVVSDGQWKAFVKAFDLGAIGSDPALALNNQRVQARDRVIPVVRALFAALSREEIVAVLEPLGLPFAPIARPQDLFDDPHLTASGGLVELTIGGERHSLPALPISIDGERAGVRYDLREPGADLAEVLADLPLDEAVRERLLAGASDAA